MAQLVEWLLGTDTRDLQIQSSHRQILLNNCQQYLNVENKGKRGQECQNKKYPSLLPAVIETHFPFTD